MSLFPPPRSLYETALEAETVLGSDTKEAARLFYEVGRDRPQDPVSPMHSRAVWGSETAYLPPL